MFEANALCCGLTAFKDSATTFPKRSTAFCCCGKVFDETFSSTFSSVFFSFICFVFDVDCPSPVDSTFFLNWSHELQRKICKPFLMNF